MNQCEKSEKTFTHNIEDQPDTSLKKYQISSDYLLRQVGDECAIIPVGEEAVISNAILVPNESAVFLWNEFLLPSTEEDVVKRCLQVYGEDVGDQIKEDVHRFVQESLMHKILKEVM